MRADYYKGEPKAFFVKIRIWRSILAENIDLGQNEETFCDFFPETNESAFS